MQLALYIPAAAALIITPGMDTLFLLNTAVGSGKQRGIMAAAGISIGVLCHTLFAALGMAAMIAASPVLYKVIQYAGAAYLIWLGVSKLLEIRRAQGLKLEPVQRSSRQTFQSGLLTNLLNPKVILFCIAFMPQFINPASAHYTAEFLLLGVVYAVMSMLWLTLLAVLAGGRFTRRLPSEKAGKILDAVSGTVFIGMGIKAALSK